MAIKDYWIYQRRDVPVPWAIYVVKEYDRRKPDATSLDLTLYSEDIQSSTHSRSFVNIKHTRIDDYVHDIVLKLGEFANVTLEDREQLRRALEDVFLG